MRLLTPRSYNRMVVYVQIAPPDFDRVFGAELDGLHSDKTDLLRHALQTTAVDPSQAIMIGDRSFDIVGARNNGMTAVGVLYGYGSEAEGILAKK